MASTHRLRPLGECILSEKVLRQASALVYDTDPYIYPAMFSTRDEACTIISWMLRDGADPMFRPENLFVCLSGDDVVGILLWHRGPLGWNAEAYLKACKALGLEASPNLESVKKGYFEDYSLTGQDTVAIINLCVDARARGMGIGKELLSGFLSTPEQLPCAHELVVLADNSSAIGLYGSLGFEIVGRGPGFSLGTRPDVLAMRRPQQSV